MAAGGIGSGAGQPGPVARRCRRCRTGFPPGERPGQRAERLRGPC